MKRQLLVNALCGSAIACILTAVFAQPNQAQTLTIDCINADTKPTTKIETPWKEGKQEVLEIRWYNVFPRQAKQLCQQNTEKMRRYTQNAGNFYISRGQIGKKFGLCLVKNANDSCNSNSDFLFEPRTETNPDRFLSTLIKTKIRVTDEGVRFPRYPNRRLSFLTFLLP